MNNSKISVLIVTYNSMDYILDCLKSVYQSKLEGFSLEVIISDNASKDDTVSLITKNYGKSKIITNKNNTGFAGGINIAIKKGLESDSDYFFILNPDTLIKKDTILNLFKFRGEADILSPKIYFTDNPKVIWYAGGKIDWNNCYGTHIGVDEEDCGQYDQIKEIDYSTGCGELVSRKVFEKVGFMNEKYFLYLEDLDFSLRAKKNGFKIKYIPTSSMFHHNAKSSSVGSPIQDYYITRNRMYFALIYAPIRTKIAVFRQSFGFLINGRKAQKIAVQDFLMFKMYTGSIFKKI